jgi:Flp pilus assembly pilin Flp
MKTFLNRFAGSDRGASMVEYGLMVALIAVIAIPAIAMVGHRTEDTFNVVGESLAAGDGGNGGNETPAPGGNDDDSPAPGDDDDSPAPGDDDDSPAPGDDDDSPAPGDIDDDPSVAEPGSEAVVTSTDSSLFWWNNTKQGGNGAWKAAVHYQNDHNRHQYLTLEVTRTDNKGKTTTSSVNGFYVPANGNATYEVWDNNLKLHKGKTTGVLSVDVKVVSVTTADENWQPVTYPQYNKSTTVDAPTP